MIVAIDQSMRSQLFSTEPKDLIRSFFLAGLGALLAIAGAYAKQHDQESGIPAKSPGEFTRAVKSPQFVARVESLLNSELSRQLGLPAYSLNLDSNEEVLPQRTLAKNSEGQR